MTGPEALSATAENVTEALRAVEELLRRRGISAIEDFLGSCRAFARETTLNIAVFGRFKAGKSSFLNHLLGRAALPVGAIPITAVVTEIEWGVQERAEIRFADGRTEETDAGRIEDYISESWNPGNAKGVTGVRVFQPEMERYRGIRFVDTPGLESVLEHNTDASLEWLPNVGIALVAVGVDTPLSQHDIDLIRTLSRYTPNISLLLTKVDVLNEAERAQVSEFVRRQLARFGSGAVPVFPYSVRAGFENLRAELERNLLAQARACSGEERTAILLHKLDSLLRECGEYLHVALKAAEVADSEREELRRKILGQKEALEDTRLGLRLVARHAAGNARAAFEALLQPDEAALRERLQAGIDQRFPEWARSLSVATEEYERWMSASLSREISALSAKHRSEFSAPGRRAARQLSQSLQDFRNRLSERMLEALCVPLRTTEMELAAEEPKSPDIRIGRIFDHNWELLSWLVPMRLVRGALRKHYLRKAGDLTFTNLSRLAAQWEAVAAAALLALERESMRRLDGLIGTIDKLIASASREAPAIREDIVRIEQLRRSLRRSD